MRKAVQNDTLGIKRQDRPCRMMSSFFDLCSKRKRFHFYKESPPTPSRDFANTKFFFFFIQICIFFLKM